MFDVFTWGDVAIASEAIESSKMTRATISTKRVDYLTFGRYFYGSWNSRCFLKLFVQIVMTCEFEFAYVLAYFKL